MNTYFKTLMYRIISAFIFFFLFNSCDQKSMEFSPNPGEALDFVSLSFNMDLSNSSITNTPEYIDQDLGSLVYVGSIPEDSQGDRSSYALFQINWQILEEYGFCEENQEENTEGNQEITKKGDIKFRLFSSDDIEGDYSELSAYYYDGNIDFDTIKS